MKGTGKDYVTLIVYVDDLIIASPTKALLDWVVDSLSEKFVIKDLGEPSLILGVQVRNEKDRITFGQSNYVLKAARDVGIEYPARVTSTPMTANIELPRGKKNPEVEEPFRRIIGKLMYICMVTRLDSLFATTLLSRYLNEANQEHYEQAKKTMKYLMSTKDMAISFPKNGKIELAAYTDSDHNQCPITKRSTSGVIVLLNGAPIYWKCSRQTVISTSTMESEIVALSESINPIKWVIKLLCDLHQQVELPVRVYCDNTAAIESTRTKSLSPSTRHIAIKDLRVIEAVSDGLIEIVYIPTEDNVADVLTKSLLKNKQSKFRSSLLKNQN